ncbi:hypothetical protein CF319_g6312 [Tilletia indica]|uniref:Uncharacterized protein n=1 Tax=Tilletia indica TaxID=43049 RepID=A0A177TSF2_9BASI|nr:hypothetical protein CF319_g6312 [Tilletia indica]KAE8260195.1 hypothetical protein A4X13_0g507 [Tilletia indica]
MRAPYDVGQQVNSGVDEEREVEELVGLAAHALSSSYSNNYDCPSLPTRTQTLATFLLAPYILLSYSLRSIVLAFHALVPQEDHFYARIDILVPIFRQNVNVLTTSSAIQDPNTSTTTVHFAQARVAVILAILQLPYLGAHYGAQPFYHLIEVTLDHARNHTPPDSLPEKSLGPLRLLLEAIAPPAGNGRIQTLSTATPFEIIIHGRVIGHSQELDPHEFQTLHESRVRTALRILANATAQSVGLRDSRTINEVLAELDLHEVRFSPACLAFPALAARNPNTAIQVLTRICDLSSSKPTHNSQIDLFTLPNLLDELAHTLDPSSLRSLDLVIRLVRDPTPTEYSLPLHEIAHASRPPLIPSALGLLTQIVLLGTFLHRCMTRLTSAYNDDLGRSDNQRRGVRGGADSDREQSAGNEDLHKAVQDAMANLWSGSSILDDRITDGAVPSLIRDSNLNKGKGKLGQMEHEESRATLLPYRLDPSPQITDEVSWERELRNFCQLVRALLTSDTILASPYPDFLITQPPIAFVSAALHDHSRSISEAVRIELRQFMLEYGRYKAANEIHRLLVETEEQFD